jgi:hypothetical protein
MLGEYVYIYIYTCTCTCTCKTKWTYMLCEYIYKYMYIYIYTYMHMQKEKVKMHVCITCMYAHLKLIAFELAAKFSRRRKNPVQPRLCNAKNAIFKRLRTGFSLRSRSSPANSNAITSMYEHACWVSNKLCIYVVCLPVQYICIFYTCVFVYFYKYVYTYIHTYIYEMYWSSWWTIPACMYVCMYLCKRTSYIVNNTCMYVCMYVYT